MVGARFEFTLLFASQLSKVKIGTDPRHMLPVTSPIREYSDRVEGWFALLPDVIILGAQSEKGIFTTEALHPPGAVQQRSIPDLIYPGCR